MGRGEGMSLWSNFTLFITGILMLAFISLVWIIIETVIEKRLESKAKNAKMINEIAKTNHETMKLQNDINRMTKE